MMIGNKEIRVAGLTGTTPANKDKFITKAEEEGTVLTLEKYIEQRNDESINEKLLVYTVDIIKEKIISNHKKLKATRETKQEKLYAILASLEQGQNKQFVQQVKAYGIRNFIAHIEIIAEPYEAIKITQKYFRLTNK